MYTITDDNLEVLTTNANTVKDGFLDRLEHDDILNPGEADRLKTRYAVFAVKKGMLGTLVDKMFGHEESKFYYRIVGL